MAVSDTTRLLLKKQDDGEQDWGATLNTGFDNADARFCKFSDGAGGSEDPNTYGGGVAVDYAGQKYIDKESDPPRVWIGQTGTTWELISAAGVRAVTPIDGDSILEDIIQDLHTRIQTLEAAAGLTRGHISGLQMRHLTATSFEITAGSSADSTAAVIMQQGSTWSKTTGSWVAGTGNGAMSSSLAGDATPHPRLDTWYHVFQTYNTTGPVTDIGLDIDVGAANLIADHGINYYRRIGSILYGPTVAEIRAFRQFGDYFWYWQPINDLQGVNYSPGFFPIYAPPDVRTLADVGVFWQEASTGIRSILMSPGDNNQTVDYTNGFVSDTGVGGPRSGFRQWVWTDGTAFANIRVDEDTSVIEFFNVGTFGWMDNRGKDE